VFEKPAAGSGNTPVLSILTREKDLWWQKKNAACLTGSVSSLIKMLTVDSAITAGAATTFTARSAFGTVAMVA